MSKAAHRARAVLSIITMLAVAPVVAIVTMVCLHPSQWDAKFNPLSIIGFVIFAFPFALMTPQLWPTYFPAIMFIPLVMKYIALRPGFSATPLKTFVACSFLIGALAGVGVMSLLIVLALKENPSEAVDWVWMGIVSGGITFTLITLLYRQPARIE
jgi:hypothetical protein